MKDYKEMTESVLRQANARAAQRTRQRRMATGLIAVTLCFAILITVVGFGVGRNPAGMTQPTISMENPTTVPATQPVEPKPTQPETTAPEEEIVVTTGNVFFLSATKEEAELAPLQANMIMPWDHVLYVRSLMGATEEERSKAIEEERQAQIAFREKYGLLIGQGRYCNYYSENAVIRYYSAGLASLILLNNALIESVNCETTGVLDIGGRCSSLQEDYVVGKGEYAVTIPGGSRRVYLDCNLTKKTQKIFEENPETPLSTIRETITITIHYKNGTKEIIVIDVTVDDDGQIYMTQRGNSTSV